MSTTKTKPSLSGLMQQQKTARRKSKPKAPPPETAVAVAEPPPLATPANAEQTRALGRKLMVRRFVTAYIKHDMDGAKAYREINPNAAQNSSWSRASELIQQDDVRAELARQLQGLFRHADMDEDWVFRQWRAMAFSDIFDYMDIDADGKVTWKLDPEKLTQEQRLNIRGIKVDPKTGKVVELRLVDRQGAVESVAQARKLYSVLQDTGLKDLVKEITERMQAASKHVRTFDHDTGEEIG